MSGGHPYEDLAKLSPEDLADYWIDFHVFGTAAIKKFDDGRVVYVPVEDIHLPPPECAP